MRWWTRAETVRASAVEALGKLRDRRSVSGLTGALGDVDSAIREKAADVLGRLGDSRTVPRLAAALKDPKLAVRTAALRSLSRLDLTAHADVVVTALVGFLQDRRFIFAGASEDRELGIRMLGALRDPRAIPYLTRVLESSRMEEGPHAARALGEIGDPQAIPALVRAIENERDETGGTRSSRLFSRMRERRVNPKAAASARALGRLGDQSAVPALADALRLSRNPDTRRAAAESLGRLKAVHAIPHLLAALDDEAPRVIRSVARSLRQLGDTMATQVMTDRLFSPASSVHERRIAAVVMGEMRDSTAVNPLIQALGDSDPVVRAEAARALGRIGDIEAGQRLIHMVNDKAPDVREAAIEALARMGAAQKMEHKPGSLDDADPSVRQSVEQLLDDWESS